MLRDKYSALFDLIESQMKPNFLVYNTHHIINADHSVDIGIVVNKNLNNIDKIIEKINVKKIIHGSNEIKSNLPAEFNSNFKDVVLLVILNEKKEYFLKIYK